MSKHLPINGDCHPKQWIALCGATGRHTSFVTDFNDASCEECRMLELSYVHTSENRSDDSWSTAIFDMAVESGREVVEVVLEGEQPEYNQFTADDVPLFV